MQLLLAIWQIGWLFHQYLERLAKASQKLIGSKPLHLGRGELQGEWQAIQSSANLCDCWRICGRKWKIAVDIAGPHDKELDRLGLGHYCWQQATIVRRNTEMLEANNVFTANSEPAATGSKHHQTWTHR